MSSKFTFTPDTLLDTFVTTGSDLNELKEVLKEMADHTFFEEWHSGDICLLSSPSIITGMYEKKDAKGETVKVDGIPVMEEVEVVKNYFIDPANLPTAHLDYPMSKWEKKYGKATAPSEKLLNEWVNINKVAFAVTINAEQHKYVFYLASATALQTLDRFGLSGKAICTPSLSRDIFIAERFKMDLPVTLAVKRVSNGAGGTAKKIFTILSDRYAHIPQETIFDAIEKIRESGKLGEPKCHHWEVTNFYTNVYIEFPEKATEYTMLYGLKQEMIPGIMISTSDTGDASFTIAGTWRVDGCKTAIVNSSVKKKHSGEVDIDKMLKEATEKVFEQYAKLPEALCNLMAYDITDPSWDIRTPSSAGYLANQNRLQETIKAVFKKIGIVKAIGKKTEKILREEMFKELDPSMHYTAYDICMLIMQLPDRVVMSNKDKDISLLQTACCHAPFVDYNPDTTIVLA